jgi:hypothetical protein
MDLSDEGVPKAPALPPPPVTAQPLQVTPENVVELALLFQNAAISLRAELQSAKNALQLAEPWMGDGASKWMRDHFQEYFIDGENSFLKVLQAIHDQHQAHADALEAVAAQYGMLEELNAARHNALRSELADRFPGPIR